MNTASRVRQPRRKRLARGLVAAGVIGGLLAGAAGAQATITIGQSIAGVKIGDTEARVRQVLGAPTGDEKNSFFYPTSVGLRIGFAHGRVDGVLSFSKKQKTAKRITIGSSRAQVRRAYPGAMCVEGPYGAGSLYCAVTARFRGRKTFTSFLFAGSGGTEEIELGYGMGLAQELKKQGK